MKLDIDSDKRLKIIRVITLVEFVLANLGSIGLVLGRVLLAAEEPEQFLSAWLMVILPALLSGAALLFYHARVIKRPWGSLLGEIATWAVFPLMSAIFLAWLGA